LSGKNTPNKKTDNDKYIAEIKPLVISVNFALVGVDVDFIFASNNLRYSENHFNLPQLRNKLLLILLERRFGIHWQITTKCDALGTNKLGIDFLAATYGFCFKNTEKLKLVIK
jgi:hypothetical protein